MEDLARQECKEGIFRRGELPGRFMARKLFRWSDKKYNQEYWGRMERNWRWWKEKQSGEGKIETIAKKEKIKEENSEVREQTEEDDNEIGNIMDPYYELQEIPWDKET